MNIVLAINLSALKFKTIHFFLCEVSNVLAADTDL